MNIQKLLIELGYSKEETILIMQEPTLEPYNEKLAQIALTAQTELLGKIVISGSNHMKLRFDFND